MFFVYILKSIKNGKYYIGSTQKVERRLIEHNSGKVQSTKRLIPLLIVYTESYLTNGDARKREAHIKRQKSRKYIESLIKSKKDKNRGVA